MANILLIYSTTDGHTRSICSKIQQVVEADDHKVSVLPMSDFANVDLRPFDKIVVGASIRYGKHQRQVFDFINTNQAVLDRKPSAFFSVNVVARKPEKNQPETNPYLLKFLKQVSWQPQTLAVFAGKIDYPRYGFVDKHMIRFIMWMTKGPTDLKTSNEFTNWDEVERFGQTVAAM